MIHREEAGFTLIELMTVILVILILAAALIPQFGIARERARKAICVSNQRDIETAVAMWQTDNPGILLGGGQMHRGSTTPNIRDLTGVTSTVVYTTTDAFHEPDDPAPSGSNGWDYYLSMGAPTRGTANPYAPSYGHVSCAADGVADPWVAGYDGSIAPEVTAINHTRGASTSP